VSSSQRPHFSQRTREMGHPVYIDGLDQNDGELSDANENAADACRGT
jgi:hypothetical protein